MRNGRRTNSFPQHSIMALVVGTDGAPAVDKLKTRPILPFSCPDSRSIVAHVFHRAHRSAPRARPGRPPNGSPRRRSRLPAVRRRPRPALGAVPHLRAGRRSAWYPTALSVYRLQEDVQRSHRDPSRPPQTTRPLGRPLCWRPREPDAAKDGRPAGDQHEHDLSLAASPASRDRGRRPHGASRRDRFRHRGVHLFGEGAKGAGPAGATEGVGLAALCAASREGARCPRRERGHGRGVDGARPLRGGRPGADIGESASWRD